MCLAHVAEQYMNSSGLNPVLAYGQSDEISFLFHSGNQFYKRRVEKLCSVSAGFISSAFVIDWLKYWEMKIPPTVNISFDARVIPLYGNDEVAEYFQERQYDAWRNCVSSYAFWTLVDKGKVSASNAARRLDKMDTEGRIELLQDEFNINMAEVTSWHRRGYSINWIYVKKKGYNPITDEHVTTTRRMTCTQFKLPSFAEDDGIQYILKTIGELHE
jgi:tRNA(His) 5'-end guanylyltransferase